jgi:norsolorinic acid ketoreductase
MPYTVLISGANKGLGLSLLEKYLSRADTTVVATVRDYSKQQALNDIPKASGSKLVIVKVESRSDTDCLEAISTIKDQGINQLDVVIANAAYYTPPADPKVAKITATDLLDHVNVNTAGPIRLFQASLPLLQKAEKPIFAYMSSLAGSITATGEVPFSAGVYGASKAASNFLVRRAHAEHPELIIFAMHPGYVPDLSLTLERVADGRLQSCGN